MGNKKGLSDIVITLLIVVLSLVAIGGTWFVVRNVLNKGSSQTDYAARCLTVAVDATRVTCVNGTTNKECSVTLVKSGAEVISGVNLVFKNSVTGVLSSALVNSAGDVPEVVGRQALTLDTLVAKANALDTVEVIPYFTDASGNVKRCDQRTSFKFTAV